MKYAVHLFSDTVAKAFKFKFDDEFLEQAKIITTIDSWFDVCDSRSKFHWKNLKCGLGVHEDKQIEALKNMQDLVKSMSFGKENAKQKKKPFQTGIIVSINAMLDLYAELKSEGVSYLLTSRLNQDGLEIFFSQLRAIGGNSTHPSTVETISRIRTLCLSKNVKSIICNSSVENQDDSNFLSVELVDQFEIDVPIDSTTVDGFLHSELPELDTNSNEPRNYVAGYICHKLKLEKCNDRKPNSWI